jgi:hypothetical protein
VIHAITRVVTDLPVKKDSVHHCSSNSASLSQGHVHSPRLRHRFIRWPTAGVNIVRLRLAHTSPNFDWREHRQASTSLCLTKQAYYAPCNLPTMYSVDTRELYIINRVLGSIKKHDHPASKRIRFEHSHLSISLLKLH